AASISSIVDGFRDAWQVRSLPRAEVKLMASAAKLNHPFYERLVQEFYAMCRRRHRRWFWIRQFEVGVALCRLQESFDEYFSSIEASARRNVKKARRLGYTVRIINYNEHLDDITAIRRS